MLGTGYYAIAHYDDFVQSVGTLVSQMRSLLRRFFGRRSPTPFSIIGGCVPDLPFTAWKLDSLVKSLCRSN